MDLLNIKKNTVTRGVGNKHFLFYGDPGTRKTSVASLFPNSLILATEIGYKQIPDAVAVDIDSWATFLKVITELKKPEVKNTYKTIIIDTVSILSDLCVQYICNLNSIKSLDELGFGKGWNKYKTDFNRAINTIAQNGYAIVFIAHAEAKKDEKGNVVSIEPRIDRRPREAIEALTDFIFYLQKEVVDEDRETVIAYSNLPQNVMTKSRIRGFAPSFEFTFENVEREINKALDNYSGVYNGAVVGEEVHGVEIKKELVPFEKVKEETIELAQHYLQTEVYKDQATSIIMGAMGGVRLSEAPESYRQVLLDLQAELRSLDA